MKFSKYIGFTFALLGSLGFLFFGVLFLLTILPAQFPEEFSDSILPKDLLELTIRLRSNDPTDLSETVDKLKLLGLDLPTILNLLESNNPAAHGFLTGGYLFFGIQFTIEDLFAFSIAFTALGLGLTFASITSLFSPLSSITISVLSFLVIAAGIVGGLFQTHDDLSDVTVDALPGVASVLSPLMLVLVGTFFQFAYFSKRRKLRRD